MHWLAPSRLPWATSPHCSSCMSLLINSWIFKKLILLANAILGIFLSYKNLSCWNIRIARKRIDNSSFFLAGGWTGISWPARCRWRSSLSFSTGTYLNCEYYSSFPRPHGVVFLPFSLLMTLDLHAEMLGQTIWPALSAHPYKEVRICSSRGLRFYFILIVHVLL